jgi:hypothetical protein
MTRDNQLLLWVKMKMAYRDKLEFRTQYDKSNTRKANSKTLSAKTLISQGHEIEKPVHADLKPVKVPLLPQQKSDSKEHMEKAIGMIWKPSDRARKQML